MISNKLKDYLKGRRKYFYQFPFPVCVYLHWTAGRYHTTFGEYHFCVDGDGDVINTAPIDEPSAATWHRNTGSISIALCCCYDGTPNDLGAYPPTEAQIEAVAELMATIAEVFEIPIDREHFMTHGEAADIDGYGLYSGESDCRWDLHILKNGDAWGSGGDIIRGKAQWYLENGV